MKTSTRNLQATRIAISAALGVAALLFVGCPQAGDRSVAESEGPAQLDAAVQSEAAQAARAAEARALEQRLAEAAEAEAEALAAAEQALAEREAVLKLREEQVRREEALRQERTRIAQRRAEAEELERRLAAKEKELENFEANLAFQERELEDRETELEETLEAIDLPDESGSFETESAGERFEDPAAIRTQPAYASLEPGRLLEVEFEETVSSATHRRGDRFKGRLVQDLTAEDGTLVVPAGTEVVGRVVDATPLKRVGGQASLEVEFTHLVLSPQETVAISASFVELGSDKRKDKKKIAGAAIVGAILGRVLGGDGAEGVLAGAAAGAAAGTVAVTRGQGEEARIEKGQSVALQLDEVVTVEIQMTGPADR